MESAPLLSVIIPVFAHSSMPHLRPRLEGLMQELPHCSGIEFIVVDQSPSSTHGTSSNAAIDCEALTYVRLPVSENSWSLTQARNTGAELARGQALAFFDLDLRVSPDFWQRLVDFLAVLGIPFNKKRHVAIPCLYLTERGTEQFLQQEPETRHLHFMLKWLHGDSENVLLLAPCSSFMVVDRLHYLAIGGHDSKFNGHGFEDFELHHRLVSEAKLLPTPANPYDDFGSWTISSYKGFRARFALLGKEALTANLMAVHLWHRRPELNPFYLAKDRNRSYLRLAMKEFDDTGVHPAPLVASEAKSKRFLFLGVAGSRSSKTLRDIFPLLGAPFYASEHDYLGPGGAFDERKFRLDLIENNIRQVLLPNPYRNAARQMIYKWCKTNEFPFLVFERGALPDSWFFDDSGFQSDSIKFGVEYWDHPIASDELDAVKAYINWCLEGHRTLEKQGPRKDSDSIKKDLGLVGKKILFVPLQRPSDTVTVYFAGNSGSFRGFTKLIDKCAEYLAKSGWVVLCKRHPYENEDPTFRFAKCVDSETNFLDLLAAADSVAVMNSSVGLYAMMAGKACHVFSSAFYSFSSLNEAIVSGDAADIAKQIEGGMCVDMERVYRFIRYLAQEYYSFGFAQYDSWLDADGSSRRAATSIDFREIRIPNLSPVKYSERLPEFLSTAAPMFDQYWRTFRS